MALVGGGKVVAAEPGVARRLWRVVRAVLYMLRRGLQAPSGRKLAMDLHLLLRRGKIAGKALGHLVTFHHHHHNHGHGFSASAAAAGSSSLSCRGIDPALAVYEPSRGRRREVEFSCSNTPSSTTGGGGGGGLLGRRRGNRHHRRDDYEFSNDAGAGGSGYYDHGYDAAYVARVFEMLNDSEHLFNDDDAAVAVAPATAETTPLWTPARSHHSHSPAPAAPNRHRGRTTDSPFAASNGDEAGGGAQQQVDRKADEFIWRVYEQLRAQRSVAATPDYYGASPYAGRRAPRPVAAGIA